MLIVDRARSLAALAVVAGLLAAAGPAGASSGVVTDNKDPDKLVRAHVFSGDAYDNEMGLTARMLPEVDDEVLMADMGGQYLAVTRPAADGIIAVLIGLRHTDGG